MPGDEPLPRGDLLTSRALSGFRAGWLAVPRLREVGLLPPAIRSRNVACQRAATLRERRFPCDVIARWLDAEGYAAPNPDPGYWTRSDVLKLLREARSGQPATLPDKPQGAPAALPSLEREIVVNGSQGAWPLSSATPTERGPRTVNLRRV